KNQVISAQTSFGSQPQNLSQAICAHIAAKIKPPKVNTGNPIATERYITSSTSCGLIFLSQGCTLAPTRFLVSNRIKPYKTVPSINDHINVFSFLGAASHWNQVGALSKGSILSESTNPAPLGPDIAGI